LSRAILSLAVGARGVDSMAEAVARQMKLATIIFKADWNTAWQASRLSPKYRYRQRG
jgi:hypothetical protein